VLLFFLPLLCFSDPSVVTTSDGQVAGTIVNGFRQFLGIPFAEPAVGALRWEAPKPRAPWSGVFNATSYGDCCPQPNSWASPQSEDCLNLNVYTPFPVQARLLPVMVWIYGGAFIEGCSSQEIYKGDFFANSTNVIIVSVNYRLGALGFLCDQNATIKGNFGIMDQMLALQWVQQNIKAFGGDPARVTIFGESAGAMSVTLHLVSPQTFSKKYFSQAIVESNPVAMQYRTPQQSQTEADTLASDLGCTGDTRKECLRNVEWKTVVLKQGSAVSVGLSLSLLKWQPVLDPNIVPDQPLKLFNQQKNYPVPVIFGTNRNESLIFLDNLIPSRNVTESLYRGVISFLWRGNAAGIFKLYPPVSGNNFDTISALVTDFLFTCPTRSLALNSALNTNSTFLYAFDHTPSVDEVDHSFKDCFQVPVVCHASELTFVWHSTDFTPFKHTPVEQKLSWNMLNTWANFAHGNLDQSFWPAYSNSSRTSLVWDIPASKKMNAKGAACDFFDSIGYNWL